MTSIIAVDEIVPIMLKFKVFSSSLAREESASRTMPGADAQTEG
ncbi:hypothetical protein [Candidatus Rhodoblastus alkanivorans]|nr:hypothetical protein [Candidatus Rhodoblastus alkanivorans]